MKQRANSFLEFASPTDSGSTHCASFVLKNIGPIAFIDLIIFFGYAAIAIERPPDLNIRGSGAKSVRWKSPTRTGSHRADGSAPFGHGRAGLSATIGKLRSSAATCLYQEQSRCLSPPVAIVGSRNASMVGARFTERLARDLGDVGFAIISTSNRIIAGFSRGKRSGSLISARMAGEMTARCSHCSIAARSTHPRNKCTSETKRNISDLRCRRYRFFVPSDQP